MIATTVLTTALAAACAFVALPAGATTPDPDCFYDFKTGTLEYYRPGVGEGVFLNQKNEVSVWYVYGPEPMQVYPSMVVMEDCASQKTLRITYPRDQRDAADRRFEDMVYGAAPYTLREIAREMERNGAKARFGKADLGPCGCGRS